MGRLTTHVLDTATGKPASGLTVELFRLDGKTTKLATIRTNKDGRCEAPLLEGPNFTAGTYELVFHVGGYFGSGSFLDQVPVRFKVADAETHYHVPLLVSPYSYTTYRGS